MGFGLRLPVYGVLEHMDIVGLDMGMSITDYVCQDLYNEPKSPDAIRQRVNNGDLGAKTGKGFYNWTQEKAAEVRDRREPFCGRIPEVRLCEEPGIARQAPLYSELQQKKELDTVPRYGV